MSLNAVLWPSWLGSITASRNQTVFNSIQYNYKQKAKKLSINL